MPGATLTLLGEQCSSASKSIQQLTELILRSRYNDATVEFTPLGSGYRLMLEYDLILPSPAKLPSPAHISNEKNKLRGLLAAWNDRVEKDASLPTLLAYICDSYYTSQSLSLNVLQDNDRLRAACLEDLYTQLGIGLCIADLDRTRSGFCGFYPNRYDYQHDIETEDLNEIILTNIVDLDGNTVGGGFSIEEDKHFIQSEPFDEVPDEKDFKSGGIVTYYHRRTVSLL